MLKTLICRSLTPFIWLIFALAIFYFDDNNSFTTHNWYLACIYLSYFLCLYNWIARGNRFFSLFVLFVMFSLFYNVSQSLIYAFTEEDTVLYVYSHYSLSEVCYMLKFQFLCIAGFYLGTSLYLDRKCHNVSRQQIDYYYEKKRPSHLKNEKILFKLFLLCAVCVFGFTIYQLRLRQTMTYSELYQNRELISPYFSLGTMLIGLYFIYQKRHVKLVYFFYIWFIVAYTLAGTRSMSMVYVSALWLTTPMVYPKYFQRKYYPIILGVAVSAIASISVVSSMRTSDMTSGPSVDTGEMGVLFASLREMGTSQVPTMITIEHFPEQGYSPTVLYFLIKLIIPADLLEGIVPDSWRLRIGKWTTDISNTTYTQWGSSWLAEGYINYGEFAWIFTLLYGYIIVWAENGALIRIMKGKYLLAICLLTCLCKQIFFARAEIALLTDYLKPCVYIAIIWLIINLYKRNHSHENSDIGRRIRLQNQ